jgi:two-component system, NtrC family, response regulator PilR
MPNILICDDVRSVCEMLDIALRKAGHKVETVNHGEAAKQKLESARYDVLVCDIKMPQVDGLQVLKHARQVSPETAVIMITAIEDYESAVQALKLGACDYLHKGPGLIDEVRHSVQAAIEMLQLRRENQAFRRDAAQRHGLDNIVGSSPKISALKELIRTVAGTQSTILIHGESGTGKELVARAIHACSPRAEMPFVSINCGAFPETLLESELFGYIKGAFTGANQNRRGLFEEANTGTIFLDEVGEMTPSMQVKLLRVLQERLVRPVGGTSETPIDVRVVAATNRNLETMVTEGTFREDLYYRLNVIPVEVAPLRQRAEDVDLLASHFAKKYAAAANKPIRSIDPDSVDRLRNFDWPGNVRQLENVIERAVAMETTEMLHVELNPGRRAAAAAAGAESVLPSNFSVPSVGVDMERYVADMERQILVSALKQANGVQVRAAELLKLSYRSFRHLMKKYDL